MIVTLLAISLCAGLAAAWANKAKRVGLMMAISGGIWVAGILTVNRGRQAAGPEIENGATLINLGLLMILLGLALSTALATGRLTRSRVGPIAAGLLGGSLTLMCLIILYGMTFGFIG